jgi:hypothetical protein
VIGIALLIAAVVMFFYIDDIKDKTVGFGVTVSEIIEMCNAGGGDIFNLTGQCIKAQLFYYSPWISGFFGMIFLAKAGPYRGYHGYGGAGSHNRRFRLRYKTKKRLMIIIPIIAIIAIGVFLYTNYDITIGNQKLDDLIPPESIQKTIDEISENIPVKIEPRP